MNRLKSNHQGLELNTIIYWQPMKVVKYGFNSYKLQKAAIKTLKVKIYLNLLTQLPDLS